MMSFAKMVVNAQPKNKMDFEDVNKIIRSCEEECERLKEEARNGADEKRIEEIKESIKKQEYEIFWIQKKYSESLV